MAQARHVDPDRDDDLLRLRAALDDAVSVDARRIDVVRAGGRVVLRGWVASRQEADSAITVAQAALDVPITVIDEIQVDPNLREGADDPARGERTVPAEGEKLIGDPDMLSGPGGGDEEDIGRALDESLPYSPPDTTTFPQPFGSDISMEAAPDRTDEVVAADEEPAAADLSAADLANGHPPSISPDAAPRMDEPDAVSADDLGRAPDDETLEPMVEQVPGTEQGPGAVGEHTTGGGSAGGVAATETGATGADTEHADPARSTGDVYSTPGDHRGPPSEDDDAIREDFPDRD